MANRNTSCVAMRYRIAYVMSATVAVVLAIVDIDNDGLSIGSIVWLNGGRGSGRRGREDWWGICESMEVCTLC